MVKNWKISASEYTLQMVSSLQKSIFSLHEEVRYLAIYDFPS